MKYFYQPTLPDDVKVYIILGILLTWSLVGYEKYL